MATRKLHTAIFTSYDMAVRFKEDCEKNFPEKDLWISVNVDSIFEGKFIVHWIWMDGRDDACMVSSSRSLPRYAL